MKIEEEINKIVEKHIKEIWITPYYCSKSIPNEEIWLLKNDLYELFKAKKGGRQNGEKL